MRRRNYLRIALMSQVNFERKVSIPTDLESIYPGSESYRNGGLSGRRRRIHPRFYACTLNKKFIVCGVRDVQRPWLVSDNWPPRLWATGLPEHDLSGPW